MIIKIFVCGLCRKRKKEFRSTRKHLRKHLREEHFIKHELTNGGIKVKAKQSWWIVE